MLDLKPCPFCGRVPKINKKWYTQHQRHTYGIRCCIVNLDDSHWDFLTPEDVAKKWNSRAKLKEITGAFVL